MAFNSGINVVCGLVATKNGIGLIAVRSWSQVLTSAGTTTAPNGAREPRSPVNNFDGLALGFEIQPAVDAWVTWGQNPVASATGGTTNDTACLLVRAGESRTVYPNPGDQVAWIPA